MPTHCGTSSPDAAFSQPQTEIGHRSPAPKVCHAHRIFYRTGLARQVSICLFTVVEQGRQNENRSDEPFVPRFFYLGQLLLKISERFRPEQRLCDTYKRARKEAGDIVPSWTERMLRRNGACALQFRLIARKPTRRASNP